MGLILCSVFVGMQVFFCSYWGLRLVRVVDMLCGEIEVEPLRFFCA